MNTLNEIGLVELDKTNLKEINGGSFALGFQLAFDFTNFLGISELLQNILGDSILSGDDNGDDGGILG